MTDADKTTAGSSAKSNVAIVLGIFSILTCLIPPAGIALGIVALVLGAISPHKNKKSIAAITLGVSGIVLSVMMVFIVFMAVPSLQRNSRDMARKADVAMITSHIQVYRSTHAGALPSSGEIPVEHLSRVRTISDGSALELDSANYQAGVDCSGAVGSGNFSVRIKLEKKDSYCLNN
ncbi:MAG: hypothetical protein QG629_707 [Patescibacteria group bacterium]|nr:hypothetical protein [Patescibacteria group bacterium]